MSDSNQTETGRYVQTWVDVLAEVLAEVAGSPVPCGLLAEAPAELPPAGDADLWIVAAASGPLRGEMSLRLSAATTVRLAQIFMSEPAAPVEEATPGHREAVVELLRQVSGLVATAIKPTWGEVQLRLDASAAPSWPASSTSWVRIGDDAGVWIEIQVSAALAAGIRVEKAELASPPATAVAPPSSSTAQDEKVNLNLLMDVELSVTLRFGSRRLLLREILDLNPGAVLDLDRQVQEPVDMLLDGRVVARGEVVVVDGNYGLRVTEVSPGV
jgi:flagellar motor switch protein FliN